MQNNLLEEGAKIKHMLWAMYFLKCYPNTKEGCSAAGTTKKDAVDPKTLCKYIWPMAYVLSGLTSKVVSLN